MRLLPVYLGDARRAGAIAAALGPFRCDDSVAVVANEAIVSDPRRHALELALARYRGPALVVMGARDPFGAAWADDNAAPLRGARVTKKVSAERRPLSLAGVPAPVSGAASLSRDELALRESKTCAARIGAE